MHNSTFRPVKHKPWAQAATDVTMVTHKSGDQSTDRTLAKKVTLHGQPHHTPIRVTLKFDVILLRYLGVSKQINDPNHVKNRYDRREVPVLPCQSNVYTPYNTVISFVKERYTHSEMIM